MRTLLCPTPEDTLRVGRSLGQRVGPGTVVALIGDLGAGKTVLARGLAAGLGVTTRVQSPTFVLVQAHGGGRLPFWHADLYRLGDATELEQLGLDEILGGDGVVVMEWADRFPELLPPDHLVVRLDEVAGPGSARRVTLSATGPYHEPLEAVDD
jgi:tRNA threonylcarbamoyladenosine biosynthesis protein TsaE